MHRWTDPTHTPNGLRPCVATLGNFDGVHRGHKAVINALIEVGRQRGLPTVAVTFEPHPIAVVRPEQAPSLVAPGRLREDLLALTGIDGLLVMEFTAELAHQSPDVFVREVFMRGLGARVVVVGADTRFGVRNSGDVSTLRGLGDRLGFDVIVLDDLGDGERWSSSMIRRLLADADVAGAARILGRPHRVVGEVVHGNHRGKGLGYPTANLGPDSLGLVPAEGVYAGWLTRLDLAEGEPDRTMPGAISVGTNPTFNTHDRRTVEAYVLDRDDLELYGENVMIEFTAHIRPMLKFDTIEDLLAAMASDVAACHEVLMTIVPDGS